MGALGRMVGPYAMGILYDSGGLSPVTWLAIGTAIISVAFFVVHALKNRKALETLPD